MLYPENMKLSSASIRDLPYKKDIFHPPFQTHVVFDMDKLLNKHI